MRATAFGAANRRGRQGRTTFGRTRWLVGVVCLAIVGTFAGTANAEPNAGSAVTVTLYDCSGPAGTPFPSFQTEKVPVGGAMPHVVGTTMIYKRTSLTDLTAGWTLTWGPFNDENEKPRITCNAVAPNGHLLLVTGFFTGP